MTVSKPKVAKICTVLINVVSVQWKVAEGFVFLMNKEKTLNLWLGHLAALHTKTTFTTLTSTMRKGTRFHDKNRYFFIEYSNNSHAYLNHLSCPSYHLSCLTYVMPIYTICHAHLMSCLSIPFVMPISCHAYLFSCPPTRVFS